MSGSAMPGSPELSFVRAHAEAIRLGMGPDEALGFAQGAEFASREPSVRADCLLAGMPGSRSLVRLSTCGLTCADAVPPELAGTDLEAEAHAAIDHWLPLTTAAAFSAALEAEFTPGELACLREPSLGWGGGWGGHAILGYERVLRDGLGGLEAWVRSAMAGHDATHGDWYRGILHVLSGIRAFLRKHAALAEELASAAATPGERLALMEIAARCARLADSAPTDLRDTVQLLWFIHLLDDTDSPGRIDQYLLPGYLSCGATPGERTANGRPVLEALWRRFVACRSWNVCLGGQSADGADATNELTFLFLGLQEQVNREAPNLCVRFHPGSPDRLMTRCVEVISHGAGLPALYNDEALVPALTTLGIPVADARNYAMNGCMQVDIQGLSHMGLEDGELNLAKCLELALHGGRSPVSGRIAGAQTLPAEQVTDMAILREQLRIQVEHCTTLLTRSANIFQRVIAGTAPHLFRSLFMEPCVAAGVDIKRGGALYNHGQFLTEGIANTADALAAIDHLVFRGSRLSLVELVAILDADWKGHEELRAEVRERSPRYGNDNEEPDRYAGEVVEHYFRYLRTLRTWRGGWYSGGLSTFNRAPGYGRHLAASADGRMAGETVADSCGPAQGRDRHGPTAMLTSAARLPHALAASGFCLNLRLAPTVFDGDGPGEGVDRIAAMFRAYFSMGGQQLQVNVVDAATLRDARRDPEAHRDLIVRVGGFSARFVGLDPAQQDEIISRTEHT